MITSRLKGSPKEIGYALSLFELAHDRKVHPAVRGLLNHEVPEIRQQAIRLLTRAGDSAVKGEVEKLVRDPDLGVRTEALLYLTEFDSTDPLQRIEELGDFEDFSIQAAVVAFLARPGRTQNLDAARLLMSKMVEESDADGRRARLEAARLLAVLPDVFDRELRTLLDDDDVEVARAAVLAVGALKKRSMIGELIERLAEPALTSTIVSALAPFGDRIVGTLRDSIVDMEMPAEVRREIPKVLEEIGTRGGAGGAGRERARSRRGAAVSHHCGAEPARPGASGSRHRSQADRDRCSPRRSWGITGPTRCSPRSART